MAERKADKKGRTKRKEYRVGKITLTRESEKEDWKEWIADKLIILLAYLFYYGIFTILLLSYLALVFSGAAYISPILIDVTQKLVYTGGFFEILKVGAYILFIFIGLFMITKAAVWAASYLFNLRDDFVSNDYLIFILVAGTVVLFFGVSFIQTLYQPTVPHFEARGYNITLTVDCTPAKYVWPVFGDIFQCKGKVLGLKEILESDDFRFRDININKDQPDHQGTLVISKRFLTANDNEFSLQEFKVGTPGLHEFYLGPGNQTLGNASICLGFNETVYYSLTPEEYERKQYERILFIVGFTIGTISVLLSITKAFKELIHRPPA